LNRIKATPFSIERGAKSTNVLDKHQASISIHTVCRDSAMFGEFARQEGSMSTTYLTTDELSAKIKYDVRTIRERLKDSVLLEGTHYVRPFGGRKILFVWEATRPTGFQPNTLWDYPLRWRIC